MQISLLQKPNGKVYLLPSAEQRKNMNNIPHQVKA